MMGSVEINNMGQLMTNEPPQFEPKEVAEIMRETIDPKPKASRTKQWFNLAVPSPTYDNFRMQLAVHFEEVCEMLEELEFDGTAEMDRQVAISALQGFVKKLKAKEANIKNIEEPVELLDALCDQRVTAIGVAHMLGFDIDRAIEKVDDSNFSKFVNGEPQFDEQGKIKKPTTYRKVDLSDCV